MRDALEFACLSLFLFLMIAPGIYGVHLYILMMLAWRRSGSVRSDQRAAVESFQRTAKDADWPIVTTQIPLYNELAVARRVIEAAARMDYPRGRHEVQVLDDSTDATCELVDRVAAELRQAGHDVKVVRRPTREHFKAGALAHALTTARGEFVAIFDADFVPARDFLRRLIPLIAPRPDVGCVQGRWGHLNAEETWITQALALGIDGHFGVEQGGRGWNGFLINFNGTGGIWRRAAIDDPRVGGWQGDTLTEDLDLSYRAQLVGWRLVYCVDEVCPGEVPADVDALKTQQRRWATGSMQTARKLLPTVWRSQLTLLQKLEATIHLTQYSVSIFMILMALFGRVLLLFVSPERAAPWLAWSWWLVLLAALAPSIAYVYSRWTLGGGLIGPIRVLRLIVLGMGLSVNNGAAVIAGLLTRGGEFVRTPKSGSQARDQSGTGQWGTGLRPVSCDRLSPRAYSSIKSRLWIGELALGIISLAQWAVFLRADHYVGGSFLLFYAIGLLYLGWSSRPRRKQLRAQLSEAEEQRAQADGLNPEPQAHTSGAYAGT